MKDSRGRVMLIEDESNIRFLAKKIMNSYGYEVHDFADAQDALGKIAGNYSQERPNHYNLILSDIYMPTKMDGLVFAVECAKITTSPIVLMTGGPKIDCPVNVKEILRKPFPLQDLKRILDTYAVKRN